VAVLYITPLQADIPVGGELETRVSLSNPAAKQFQAVQVVLRFDPTVLDPVRLDDDEIRPLLEGPSEAVTFTEPGVLIYQAHLARPSKMQAVELFTVRWKTLATVPATEIGFGAWRDFRTGLFNASGKNVLGGTGNDGTLGMALQVYSPEQLADGPPIGEAVFAGLAKAPRGDIRLRLVANKTEIPANEDFYVGVWFENPRLAYVSKVAFKILFDPNVLEVVDEDENNWITRGVNIFDGDYHRSFPFDIHIENAVSNQLGLITYAMACTERRALPEEGYIARIRFRPKALADSTEIRFVMGPENDPLRTRVTYLGADILGDPDVPDDGVENLLVRIVRPRPRRALAAEK